MAGRIAPAERPLTLGVIGVVWVAVAVSSLALSFIMISVMESPYPHEETPLSITEDGVNWTADHENDTLIHSEFRFLSVYLHEDRESVQWKLWSYSQSTGTFTTIAFGLRTLGGLTVSLDLTDLTGNGIFDAGDSIALTTSNGTELREDIIYRLSVVFDNGIWSFYKAYSFAIHSGALYAWDSTPRQIIL